MKKLLLIGSGILLLLFLLLLGVKELMNSRDFQLFGGIISQVETNQKVVALTFDDGPTKNVNQILPLLAKYNAKATFFLIGKEMETHPDETANIAAAGHQIGNHTYSHNRMVFKSPSYLKAEIEQTDRLIRKSGFQEDIDFRPPYGKKLAGLPFYLHREERETITWNIEPDTYYRNASDKVNHVTERIKPGSIILMHPMYDETGQELQAIEGVLQALSKEGYTFLTVNELQEYKESSD